MTPAFEKHVENIAHLGDFARVVCLFSGLEIGGRQLRCGETAVVTRSHAEALLRSGKCDLASEPCGQGNRP